MEHREALVSAVTLIARILARLGGDRRPYESLALDELSLDPRRVRLDDGLRYVEQNPSPRVRQVLLDLGRLVVNTHLRVATAKLAYNDDFTYKLVYERGQLRKVRETEAAFSSPRLNQAAQMLLDVGLFKRDGDGLRLTDDGVRLLRSDIAQ
jgi:hypothetical protein